MHTVRNKLLFYGATAFAGLASLGLHRYMMDHCFDAKGLLIAGNLPGMLLLAVGAAFAVFLLLTVRRIGGDSAYADNFPRDPVSGGLLATAGLVLALAVPELAAQTHNGVSTMAGAIPHWMEMGMAVCRLALPWLAAAAMVVLGLCRIRGRKPWPLFSGLICLFYMMMLVDDYRLWSADPQLQDYAFQLLAGVLLMLCAFHRTCCDAGIIQRKKLIATGLAAAVCCMASLSMPFQRTFYLASVLWAAGCICVTAVFPPDPEPEPEPEEEEAPAEAEE